MAENTAPDRGDSLELDVAQHDTLETLDQDPVRDPLDVGIAPPSYPPRWYERPDDFDPDQPETIEVRIAQELPDPNSAYGAPDNESGLDTVRLGGDDPDAIDADDDWIGGAEVGGRRSGRLVAPDGGGGSDNDDELYARDEGIDGGAASAEEAAMHVIDEGEF